MSLFARNFLNRLGVTSFANYDVVANVVRLNRIQCYTCLANSAFIQLETREYTGLKKPHINTALDRRHISFLENPKTRKTLSKILNKIFLIDKSKQYAIGYNWFRSLDQVNYSEFFSLLKLPDTYFSWYKVTELHVWMLLVRLMQMGEGFRVIRTSLIEAMWIDVEKRARAVEPLNKNLKKNITEIYERFKVTLVTYDEGFLSDDMVLAGALWYHFFQQKCDDPRQIEAMVSFIRYQIHYLQMVNVEEEGLNELKKQVWTSLKPHAEYLS